MAIASLVGMLVATESIAATQTRYAGAVGTNNFSGAADAVGADESACATGYSDLAAHDGFWKTFGFAIPANATIDGIEITCKRSWHTTDAPANEPHVNLGKNEATLGTQQMDWPLPAGPCGAGQGTIVFGGANDLWGLAWTPAEINSDDFTVRLFSATFGATQFGWDINWIQVTVHYTEATTTLGDGTDPGDAALAPGDAATMADAFTLQTSNGNDVITDVTVSLAAGSAAALGLVEVTDDAGAVVYGSVTDPATDTPVVTLSTNTLTATTTLTQYKLRFTPKSHAAMPAPPGASHAVTGKISDWTGAHVHAGSDAGTTTLTIDNLSPGEVTGSSATPGNGQVTVAWTNPADSDLATILVLRRAGAAVADAPVEGTTYIVGNTIGASTVAGVVASPGTSVVDAGLTNGTAYHYKVFTRDGNGNWSSAGATPAGSPATPNVTTLATGTDPANATLAPGAAATMGGAFTFQTASGNDIVTDVTVTLAAGSEAALALVEVTDDAGTIVYGSVANPASDTPAITLSTNTLTATTTATQYKLRLTPKSHAAMAAPPGASHAVTAYVSDWTGTNVHAGSDAGGTTLTIDNLSPGEVTGASATPGNGQVTVAWTNPADSDLATILVLRRAGGAVADAPVEGSTYVVGNTIGASTVAGVVASPGTSAVDAGLTNGTAYHYKVFTRDGNGNWSSAGATPAGSPATPNVTTLATGTDPANATLAPGAGATMGGAFTFQTASGNDVVTDVTVTLAAGSAAALAMVEVTDDAGTIVYGSVANPASDTPVITLSTNTLTATTTATQYKLRLTPKSHAAMAAPPGASHAVTAYVSDWTGTNVHAGSDAGGTTLTIDNLSPGEVTGASATPGNGQVTVAWTNPADSDLATILVLRRAGAAVADAPVEGTTYIVGNTIGASTVAGVVASPGTSVVDAGLTNGTAYHYKVFTRDGNGNWSAAGATPAGSPATPNVTTLANGTDPANATLAPGAAATMGGAFTFQTASGNDVIADATVTLAAGSAAALALVEVTNDAGTVVHGSVANPASDTPTITLSTNTLTATTTATQYKLRLTPKSHAAMAAPPGASHAVTAYVSNWTGTNVHAGSDGGGTTLTIDNLSPGNVTGASATPGNGQVDLAWSNPADLDLATILVLRRAGAAVADAPVEGSTYVVGNTIGASTVACVVASPGASCVDAGLTNGTVYHYKVFTSDGSGNWSAAGATPAGSPATPNVTTIASGTDPANATLAPGAGATMGGAFTFQTASGNDVVTDVTITLPAGAAAALALLEVTNDAGTVVHGSVANPAGDTPIVTLSTNTLTATTTATQYKLRLTPKSHAAMAAPPGASHAVSAYVSDWTGTNVHAGTDAGGTTLTIDNLSPGNVTGSSATPANEQVALAWTNPADVDLATILVLRRAGAAVADAPVEGATYAVGNAIGSSTVVCVVASPGTSCTDLGLTNGTAYYYRVFTRDGSGNWSSAGAVPAGSPATPFATSDLHVTKTVDDATPNEGTNVTFTVLVTNHGPDTAPGVAVTDALPAGLTYVSHTVTTGSYVSGTGIWSVGAMANGATETLTLTASTNAGTGGTTIVNGASISATGAFDPDPGNDGDTQDVTAQRADLAIVKADAPDPAASGGSMVYTLIVTNNGPSTATSVTVVDTLPTEVTLVSATPSQGTCSGTSIVTCNLGSISATGTASIEMLVTNGAPATITNRAHVSGAETDLVTGNNTDSETTTLAVSSMDDIPLTQFRRIHGFIDYTTTGGTLRTQPSNQNPCAVGASSTAGLAGIPASATIHSAYLYWGASGATVDNTITLDGASLTAERSWQSSSTTGGTTSDFFACQKNVTAQVTAKRNGNYTFSGLTFNSGNPWCNGQTVLGGWAMVVIYEDAALSGKTLVLYDGLDIERNSSVNYTLSGIWAATPPEAKTSYLVWEGDPQLSGVTERYDFNGTALSDASNPVNNVFNSTINAIGSSATYGVDFDTYDVSALVTGGSTIATATLNTGSDFVILNAVILQAKSNIIVGSVFEDVNYGGGAGRDLITAAAAAPGFSVRRPGVTVELYSSAGAFLRSTTTDANGAYGFAGLPTGDYQVRVVNSTVTSCRTGATGTEWAVQTFRTDGSSGSPVAVTDHVGGELPGSQDSPANAGAQNLSTLTAQSVTATSINTGVAITSVDFGFSFDVVVNKNASGQGSLRQFLLNANALANTNLAQLGRRAGVDNAVFMLADGSTRPGLTASYPTQFVGGVATISPTAALPTISDPAVIDATTQPGFLTTPKLELDGSAAGASADGFRVTAGASAIRGFVINDFNGSGIELAGAGGDTVQTCRLGTTANGSAAAPNAEGIHIDGSANHVIGGTSAARRNVIAGNTSRGILIDGAAASGNLVSGNFIGLAAGGLAAVAQPIGILINGAPTNTIGGTAAGAGNFVSGQTQLGISIVGGGATGNQVLGNRVGVDSTGANPVPNGTGGIQITGASGNAIGGSAGGAGNVVAYNTGPGIHVASGTGNLISSNSTHDNSGLGIDLGTTGVDLNDNGDGDAGANDLYNYAVITDATRTNTTLTVRGFARAGATIEFFVSDADPTGFGEGQTYLFTGVEGAGGDTDAGTGSYGPAIVNGVAQGTDNANRFTFAVPLPAGVTAGTRLTATARDGANNTSEFGGPALVENLRVTKRAFLADGTPLPSGVTAPKGTLVQFLLYVNNRVGAVTDFALEDVLDPAFEYVPGSMRVVNTVAACAGEDCVPAEEAAVYAAAAAQAPATDAVDADVVSFTGASRRADAGNVNVANGQLDIADNRVWALLISVRVR